ncbi:cytochrome c biogenesis protein CcsA [Rhizomonospora bruguierae]|uniref:cytochrome c biogenesis protein CcsA n=1 Tax=Rhizomonospora bruguierae TaxID=1581705 RepID=UPI001BD1B18E|nr:cytochrome c biogenesis protein CcsA [Micromonospora sp. NBRC 107566]
MPTSQPTPLLGGRRAAADRRTVGWAGAGLGAAGLVTGLSVAPTDAVQGPAQRLMYLHVPAAWTAYLAFFAVLVSSVAYLAWRDPRWDRAARAAAELGVGATVLTVVLGAIWGRAAWDVWWAWDPRLVSTVALAAVYLGQLALRWTHGDPARGARSAAVLGIAGFALVPVVHFSVVWWRSLHQQATILAPRTSPPIDAVMLAALLLCLAAATVTGAWLFLRRLAILESHTEPRTAGEARTESCGEARTEPCGEARAEARADSYAEARGGSRAEARGDSHTEPCTEAGVAGAAPAGERSAPARVPAR